MQNKNFKTTRYRFGIRYLPAIWAALRCSNNLAKQCATWSCAQSHDSKLSLWPGQPWCPWCKSQLQEFENCNFQVLREARLSEGFQGKMAERQAAIATSTEFHDFPLSICKTVFYARYFSSAFPGVPCYSLLRWGIKWGI